MATDPKAPPNKRTDAERLEALKQELRWHREQVDTTKKHIAALRDKIEAEKTETSDAPAP